ncbi:long-chain-fatty-acid--CoA ligase [Halococcus morrhuae DSM 1307]|uniref:Long-chain-fatty-acid--CoA ligase n=1 Tax=Halococcus morrhuae DSM 1307 TaxID=931277 RepID=M0M6A9_HALMO|nr:AMP-binding protein [Halococcus morrhuae]EMA41352.1 long-chain-fatty-acid--CoA ligase [Halococcus morrhuae DSM 1307]
MKFHQRTPLRHLGDLPSMGAERYGEKTAMHHQEDELSYAELEATANRVANGLVDAGVEPGDRVAIAMENNLTYMPVAFGICKVGAVAVPLNVQLAHDRLVYVLEDAGVDVLFGSERLGELVAGLNEALDLEHAFVPGGEAGGVTDYDEWVADRATEFETVDRDYESDACFQGYTSGTTGNPKGVPMTHRNILTTLQAFAETQAIDPEEDSILLITPMYHIIGLIGSTLFTLYSGRSVVLQNQVRPDVLLETIDRRGITDFTGVPALYISMVQELEANPEQYDVSSIKTLGIGAAPLAADTRNRIEDGFGVALVEGWGMTETTAGTAASARGVQKGAGCIGQPMPGVEMKLVDPVTRETRVPPEHLDPTAPAGLTGYEPDFDDEPSYTGEIAIRGPPVFEGYYNLPEKNEEVFDDEDWFYTKDIARVDEDRFLWMVDRSDDMLVVGGENVYPAEIEDELFFHPDVEEAAVVAADHEVKGEAPVAYVVCEEGATVTENEIRRFALENVAAYAHPRRVFFVDELPKSATQKVQRYKLEERVESEVGTLEPSEEL